MLAITDAGYLAQLHETAALAQAARSSEATVGHVREQLIGLLDLEDCGFEHGMLLGHPPRLEQDGSVRTRYGRWNVEEAGLPAEEVELRVSSDGQYYGRFMLTPKAGSKPSLQARLVAVALADQAGRGMAARPPSRSAP